MNLSSCYNCGIVVDLTFVQFIEIYPDEGVDEDDYYGEMNSDVIWRDGSPQETWKCPICDSFNCKEKD